MLALLMVVLCGSAVGGTLIVRPSMVYLIDDYPELAQAFRDRIYAGIDETYDELVCFGTAPAEAIPELIEQMMIDTMG